MNIGRVGGCIKPSRMQPDGKVDLRDQFPKIPLRSSWGVTLQKLELVFVICGFVALGTWLYSGEYRAYGALATICFLGIASVYLLLTSKERVYRLFACISLTVISAAIGIALLRMSGLTG